jgi:hypothetical protein
MKNLILVTFILMITLTAKAEDKLFQVTTFDPHYVEQFEKYIKTVKKDGRLWLVKVDKKMPYLLRGFFKAVNLDQVGSYQPMTLKNKSGNPFQVMVDEASKQNIKSTVAQLSSYKSRYAGTEDNRQATIWIENKFKDFGYETKQLCYKPGACSVLAEKKSKTPTEDVILVEAHFDSVVGGLIS